MPAVTQSSIADRIERRRPTCGISLRPAVAVVAGVLALPVLIGLGAKWSARAEIDQLRAENSLLQVENGSYRDGDRRPDRVRFSRSSRVINDLGARATLDPAQARAIQKLAGRREGPRRRAERPAARFGGRARSSRRSHRPKTRSACCAIVLQGLESRLRYVRRDVEQREALAAATPSIWPAHGWLTGGFGGRSDPFTGEPGFPPGHRHLDREGPAGVRHGRRHRRLGGYTGDYGNLIVLKHGFGLTTRYGHLSAFAVKSGQTVKRGDVIGYVGSTGRSTGAHLHYEILANGKLINPLQLLTPQPRSASSKPSPRPAGGPRTATIAGYPRWGHPRCRCSRPSSPKSSAPKTNAN